MLACYLVSRGWGAKDAIADVRSRRTGSITPNVQQDCVIEYAARLKKA
jgi:hypothetical protein